jgi:hypothetical protein
LLHDLEPAWHLIIGGLDGDPAHSTVEVFNWRTKERCLKSSIGEEKVDHIGMVLNKHPLVCGGTSLSCYQYNIAEDTWILVRKQIKNFGLLSM